MENIKLCTECGGNCCKTYPGGVFPEDLEKVTVGTIKALLSTGKYAIDWWEGDVREGKNTLGSSYFIRPSVKGMEGAIYDPTWGGECTFLIKAGCELSHENRPKTCRELVPDKHGECRGLGKKDEALAWIPYRRQLMQAAKQQNEDKHG